MNHAALSNSLLDFLEEMNCVTSIDAAWKQATTFMRGLGASHVANNLVQKGSSHVYLHSSPAWTGEMYLEKVYPDHDPRLAHCENNVTPYFSGKGFWSRVPELPARRQMFEQEVISVGIRSVVSVPVHMPASRDWGYFGIATDFRADEFDSFYEDHGTTLHLGAITAFNCIYALVREEQIKRIGLTGRERECLLWLAKGLHNDRIAARMNIRPATVDFHMANARRKLNAPTRDQALVAAIQMGLIEP